MNHQERQYFWQYWRLEERESVNYQGQHQNPWQCWLLEGESVNPRERQNPLQCWRLEQ